jgi:hypothetical protein
LLEPLVCPAGTVAEDGTVIFAGAADVSATTVSVADGPSRITLPIAVPSASPTGEGTDSTNPDRGLAVIRISSMTMPSEVRERLSYWLKRILKFEL